MKLTMLQPLLAASYEQDAIQEEVFIADKAGLEEKDAVKEQE